MPFPDPFLTIILIATVIGLIVPTCLHLGKELKSRDRDDRNPTNPNTGTNHEHDPFSTAATQTPAGGAQPTIKTKSKFVSVGSRTGELNFDWIVAPFQPTTETAPSDRDKPSN